MKISGIYKIVNKVNGKYYVGSSKDINKRWYHHKILLNNNIHPNDYLQNSWNKYGKENFDFIIIETLDQNKKILHEIENKHLSIAKTEMDKTYNLNFDAQGGELSEYSKKKIGNKNKGKNCFSYGEKLSKEIKQKMSIARKKRVGKDSPSYNKTIYSFLNKKTDEKFIGTCYDFRLKYNLYQGDVSGLIRKKIKVLKIGLYYFNFIFIILCIFIL